MSENIPHVSFVTYNIRHSTYKRNTDGKCVASPTYDDNNHGVIEVYGFNAEECHQQAQYIVDKIMETINAHQQN